MWLQEAEDSRRPYRSPGSTAQPRGRDYHNELHLRLRVVLELALVSILADSLPEHEARLLLVGLLLSLPVVGVALGRRRRGRRRPSWVCDDL